MRTFSVGNMINPHRQMRRTSPIGLHGFTLIELMVVVLIIALFFGLVLPNLPSLVSSTQLKRDARRIAAEVRYANDRAAMKERNYVMAIDLETGIIEVRPVESARAGNELAGIDPFQSNPIRGDGVELSQGIYFGGPTAAPDVIGLIERQRLLAGVEVGIEEEYEMNDAERERKRLMQEERDARGSLRKFSLSSQVNFNGIHLTESGESYNGVMEIIFTPNGIVESGVIHLINFEGDELSVVLDETTGDTIILEGYFDF